MSRSRYLVTVDILETSFPAKIIPKGNKRKREREREREREGERERDGTAFLAVSVARLFPCKLVEHRTES